MAGCVKSEMLARRPKKLRMSRHGGGVRWTRSEVHNTERGRALSMSTLSNRKGESNHFPSCMIKYGYIGGVGES